MSLINVLEKVFKKKSERDYLRLRPILEQVKQLRAPMAAWPDEQLQGITRVFRDRLAQGESLDDLLPEAYAAVWETCRRLAERRAAWPVFGREQAWEMVPYDVQIIGAIALHQGNIAEMATGEGKTLVATMPLYLNALPARGAHLVTVNDYLAQRDAEWMGGIYRFLGLTVAYIKNDMTPPNGGRRTRRTSPTAPTTSSASTTCVTTWPCEPRTWSSASSTSPSSTRSTRC